MLNSGATHSTVPATGTGGGLMPLPLRLLVTNAFHFIMRP
jgi:hypothetical protein